MTVRIIEGDWRQQPPAGMAICVDADSIKKLISYSPQSGIFLWSKSRRGVSAGAVAGCINQEGYRQIRVERRVYLAHRLAWLISYGEWPPGEIDHINGLRDDNRICNLRVVDRAGNSQNRRSAMSNNKSCGLLGATWNKQHQCWQSKLQENKRRHHIGYFKTAIEAHRAYMKAKDVLHIAGEKN